MIHVVLRSHLFISFCAVGLSLETSVILQRPFQSGYLYAFIFFSTLFSYNVYYIKSPDFPYAKGLALAGLAGAAISLIRMPYIPFACLFMISALSALYLLPVFVPVSKSSTFSVQKLFVLILVWVMITFLFPIRDIQFNYPHFMLLLYRILFISHLSILFFIRDETDGRFKRMATVMCIPLGMLQLVACQLIGVNGQVYISVIYSIITCMVILVSMQFNTISKPTTHYLFFVDGMMLLQSIFVLLKFLIKP